MTSNDGSKVTETPPQENVETVAIEEPSDTVDMSKFQYLEEFAGGFDPNRVRFLLYGESGSGKTVFSSTWPKPIFLDADDGMSSITLKVSRIKVNSWSMLQAAYLFIQAGQHPFKTIILDSLNEIQHLAMDNVVINFPGIHRAYNDLASQSDYGKMLDDFDKLIRAFKALPYNVIFISQVAAREYETDPVMPQMTGKNTARNICRMMDVVGYIERIDAGDPNLKPRRMIFDAANHTTKDRSRKLPAFVDLKNPDTGYQELLRYWKS